MCRLLLTSLLILLFAAAGIHGDEVIGRWDLSVQGKESEFPSWLEVRKSGYKTLVGTFVGQFGSARPIAEVKSTSDGYSFSIPPQWEQRSTDLQFQFRLRNGMLTGNTTDEEGRVIEWTGRRAPQLTRPKGMDEPAWGDEIKLFNGKDLDGWSTQLDGVPNGWLVRDGMLVNERPGNNLVSNAKFDDFKLYAEFRYPADSNSGLYLRGRYEVQIEDSLVMPQSAIKWEASMAF